MDQAQTNRNAWDTVEAEKVLESASHYLHTWPNAWGNFAESEVCILASSHQQVSCGGTSLTDVSVHSCGLVYKDILMVDAYTLIIESMYFH